MSAAKRSSSGSMKNTAASCAGLCATVIHFRTGAAIREVGKVMGLSADVTAALSGQVWGMSNKGADLARIRELGLNPDDRRQALTTRLISELIGFPRHLSQHVGGFVITRGRLDELCPIENAAMENRTVIEWDKDDIGHASASSRSISSRSAC